MPHDRRPPNELIDLRTPGNARLHQHEQLQTPPSLRLYCSPEHARIYLSRADAQGNPIGAQQDMSAELFHALRAIMNARDNVLFLVDDAGELPTLAFSLREFPPGTSEEQIFETVAAELKARKQATDEGDSHD